MSADGLNDPILPNLIYINILFLFQKINEKPQVINDYEAGRAIPNNQILSKVERIVGMINSFDNFLNN